MVTNILLGLILLGLGLIYNVLAKHLPVLERTARRAVGTIETANICAVEIRDHLLTSEEDEVWLEELADEVREEASGQEEARRDSVQRGVTLLQAEYKARGMELPDEQAKAQVEAMLSGHGPFGGAA